MSAKHFTLFLPDVVDKLAPNPASASRTRDITALATVPVGSGPYASANPALLPLDRDRMCLSSSKSEVFAVDITDGSFSSLLSIECCGPRNAREVACC